MKLQPVVLLFDPANLGDDQGAGGTLPANLQSQGLLTVNCSSLPDLTQTISLRVPDRAPISVVLLAGPIESACAAANYMRTVHPNLGMVALADTATERDMMRLLQSGVDSVCQREASGALVAAVLFRLLARVGQRAAGTVPAAAPQPLGHWHLSEQEWIINSPCGVAIPLTTGERAFMVTILGVPDLRATHQQLTDAINHAYDQRPDPLRQPRRLSVVVSRMRGKFHHYGAELPLKSVHRWGYMFSGPV